MGEEKRGNLSKIMRKWKILSENEEENSKIQKNFNAN